jgi:hypothetical protein
MTAKNRLNLNGEALRTDIMNAINKRRRGKAGQASDKDICELLTPVIMHFVEQLDGILDLHYPN